MPRLIFMIAELITLGSFIMTTIQKGPRAGLRGAATGIVRYAALGAIEKTAEYGIKKYKEKRHGKKRI